jgi:hypothetical protein
VACPQSKRGIAVAREFSLLIDKHCSMDGLGVNSTVIGSGEMGRVDLTVVFARRSGGGFDDDEGHFLHVKADARNWFDDAHPITSIRYRNMRNDCIVIRCTVLKP